LKRQLERIADTCDSEVEWVRRFTRVILSRGEDVARVQMRADLWADLLTTDEVRQRLAGATLRRRELVRTQIEEADASGELTAIPADALASIVLALADGLMLHAALDPAAFPWRQVRRAVEILFAGTEAGPSR
jgi:BetI-type transcriptional repressor, C-terminal